MVTCRDVYEGANEFLDGELPEEQCSAVMAHLEACADCNTYIAQLRSVVTEVGELEGPPATDEGKARALATYRRWQGDIEESARRPTEPMPGLARAGFWARCLSRRHLLPATGIALVVTPIFAVVNHYTCLLHGGMGLACVAQSAGLSIIPFAAAIYSSVKTEQSIH